MADISPEHDQYLRRSSEKFQLPASDWYDRSQAFRADVGPTTTTTTTTSGVFSTDPNTGHPWPYSATSPLSPPVGG